MWRESIPLPAADIAHAYFYSRGLIGLPTLPGNIRLHPGLNYWWRNPDDKPIKLGVYPALLSLVRTLDSKVFGLHKTYLQPDGNGKLVIACPAGDPLPAKKLLSVSPGATYGCAVHTYPISRDGLLAVAEGIETSLAVTLLWNIPCWPCLSEGGLRRFRLPGSVRELVICGDNDSNGVGQEAGKTLARWILQGTNAPTVKLIVPDEPDTDWLDYLNATRKGVCHG